MGWNEAKVSIGEDGFGVFYCGQCSVSVYVNAVAEGRELFGHSYGGFWSWLMVGPMRFRLLLIEMDYGVSYSCSCVVAYTMKVAYGLLLVVRLVVC